MLVWCKAERGGLTDNQQVSKLGKELFSGGNGQCRSPEV
jgi:hypothetical protein